MIKIRDAYEDDLDAICEIESGSFSAPFTREMFEGMMEGRPFGGITADNEGDVAGYLFYSTGADEMELVTVAVAERYRNKGIAALLIDKMFSVARISNVIQIFLEVRPSNLPAQALYLKMGFKNAGIRKAYYKDNNEDAIVMVKRFFSA